ncbi:MAG: PSD1 and planctomycete cytochrome C domain-containing protein [Gemmataceae bacterium]
MHVAKVSLLGLAFVCLASPARTQQKELVDPDHAAKMAKGLDLFKKSVKPILMEKCVRCHGGKKTESEFDLTDRESLLKGGLHGAVVVPGKSKDSLLMKAIRHARDPFMPRNGKKLPDQAIEQIAAWIDLGAPYDDPLVAKGERKKSSWTQRILEPEAKQWWAFEPLKKATPPAIKNEAWAKSAIDRFILAKLETAGVTPNPSASREQLIRRASFDLTGLPPTPEDVEAFVKDSLPDAWPKLIDRLMASSHYGERWGRHWLDLARFAESHGFEHDYDRPTAFHYRDFVIEAFNRNLPYDTFVKWQLAGDEYEPENPLALKATGFLAAGVHSTQITKSEVEKHRYDELDDKLHTTSTAMLGLTLGCARCHDHKYDPLPARDYYRMLSTFTTTVRSEVEIPLDSAAFAKAKAAFDREHVPFADAVTKYEAEQLSAGFEAWQKTEAAKTQPIWEILDVQSAKSKAGSKLTLQGDGSLLASDKNGKFDTYTIVGKTTSRRLQSIRIEALAHPSFPKSGPGRAGNGNFALTNLKIETTPINDPKAKPIAVKLKNPRATFQQAGLPVAAVIDADAKSAWAVDGQIGKDHAAVFDLETPLDAEGGFTLTFTLSFDNNDGHQIGRPRLSLASGEIPQDLRAAGALGKVRALLSIPAEKRTPEQKAALLDWYKPQDAGWAKLNQARVAHAAKAPQPTKTKVLIATEGLPAIRLHTQGDDFLKDTHYLRRGDPDNKEGVADQGFLQVLMPSPDAQSRWQKPMPSGSRVSGRRKAMAEWLTDVDQGAGRLLARVMVNRIWQKHLGRGIVATPSDFGNRGEAPTHPELLDWLAQQFIESGWNIQAMHKLILTSAVYQQTSTNDEAKVKLDRENKLFWKNPSRRLEAEVIRDALLAVSGELDAKMFGPGTLDEKSKRRSIYFTVKRSKLVPMMVIFDAPEALNGVAERPTTTIAPQALHLLNNANMRQYARSFAKRIERPNTEESVRLAYRTALGRSPSDEEAKEGAAFVEQEMATYPTSDAERRIKALADFCQVVMCLSEFVYVD